MPSRDEDFLSRWSRLKSEPSKSRGAETDDPQATIEDITDESALATKAKDEADLTDAELLEKFGLPDPDTMKAGDNFSAFMNNAVPDRLRRRALRVLWGSNPVLANLDELLDYGEDFTDAATVIENMQTVYQVGKGAAWKFQAEQARLAAEKAADETEAAERRTHNGDPEEPAAAEPTEAVAQDDRPEEPDLIASDAQDPDDGQPDAEAPLDVAAGDTLPLPKRPRPMRFAFD